MKNYQFPFEKLLVWNKSIDLVKSIYRKTNSFPKEEKYGLTSQIKRCAVSVASNIAEGTSRMTPRDQSHFSVIAYSSLMELTNQLIIAKELGFLDFEQYNEIRSHTEEVSRMLSALRKAQIKSSS